MISYKIGLSQLLTCFDSVKSNRDSTEFLLRRHVSLLTTPREKKPKNKTRTRKKNYNLPKT
jgi:hypothetical protein